LQLVQRIGQSNEAAPGREIEDSQRARHPEPTLACRLTTLAFVQEDKVRLGDGSQLDRSRSP
jgi:hypothetical protein